MNGEQLNQLNQDYVLLLEKKNEELVAEVDMLEMCHDQCLLYQFQIEDQLALLASENDDLKRQIVFLTQSVNYHRGQSQLFRMRYSSTPFQDIPEQGMDLPSN